MSRARNIKPGFFKNDILAECHPLARILFAGLWCEADRAGRLEDRPKKIKAECLPYDDCDIEVMLGELVSHGFILRYEVGGRRYIQIVSFAKHQNPHKNEAPSSIPAPELHGASTVQVPSPDVSTPADSSFPFPDSLNPSEIDTPAGATPAGEAALAMRKAGCMTINQSNVDFLAALAEGVTPKELADAVTAYRQEIPGAGLFTYAVKVARTNHAKAASVIQHPAARAGPAATPSKTFQAIQSARDQADELIRQSTAALGREGADYGVIEASDPRPGWASGG